VKREKINCNCVLGKILALFPVSRRDCLGFPIQQQCNTIPTSSIATISITPPPMVAII